MTNTQELIASLRSDANDHRRTATDADMNPVHTVNWQHALTADAAADHIEALSAEVERHKQDWSRFHHLMKDFGLHPGRTDDDLLDILRSQLAAQGEAVAWADPENLRDVVSSAKKIDLETINGNPGKILAAKYTLPLYTHPAPAAPVVANDDGLLPCPFCGSDEVSRSEGLTGEGKPWPYIECESCAACAEPDVWNKRAIHPTKPKGEKA